MNRRKMSLKQGLNVGEVDIMCRWTVKGCIVQLSASHTHLFSLLWVCLKSVLACRLEIAVVSSIFEFPILRLSTKTPAVQTCWCSSIQSASPLITCVCLHPGWICLFSPLLWVWYVVDFYLLFKHHQLALTELTAVSISCMTDKMVLLIRNIPTNRFHVI